MSRFFRDLVSALTSMAGAEEFDDDYVARLLAEDAKKTSQKYSSQGLSAFLPQRRAADAPKPNTRFLSHIVREADSHNAALKRKEEVEAKKRLRELRTEDDRPRKRSRIDETTNSKRNRLLKDIVSAAHSGKTTKHGHRESTRHKDTGRHVDDDDDDDDDDDGSKDLKKHRRSDRDREHRSSRRSKSRRDSSEPDRVERTEDLSSRPGRNGARCHEAGGSAAAATRRLSLDSLDGTHEQSPSNSEEPVRKRGRGASRKSSGIDDRFGKNYDPAQDVALDSDQADDAEDWDMALEAMRDRAKWKRNQAARMREAGFEEKEIVKWETSMLSKDDRERDLKDVKWSRKGEVREWDAGKIQEP